MVKSFGGCGRVDVIRHCCLDDTARNCGARWVSGVADTNAMSVDLVDLVSRLSLCVSFSSRLVKWWQMLVR